MTELKNYVDKPIGKLPVWAQSYIAELKNELRIARAACMMRTVKPERDVPQPAGDRSNHVHGWDYNAHTGFAEERWLGFYLYRADPGKDKYTAGSQIPNGYALFSTKHMALVAMRSDLERKFAEQLAKVDAMIEEAQCADG